MKKLIYIDNDGEDRAKSDLHHVQRKLIHFGGLTRTYVNTIVPHYDFVNLNQDQQIKLLFDKTHALVSFSMYTAGHHNSLYQMLGFLEYAAEASQTGIIYIDGSGNFMGDIGDEVKRHERGLHLLNAIEQNTIVSFVDTDAVRVRVGLNGIHRSPFTFEKINLPSLLSK